MHGKGTLLRAFLLWLAVLAYLAGIAYAKRLAWQDRLAANAVSRASAAVEYGKGDWLWPYLYGDWNGKHYVTSWQATCVYMIEHGRRQPALERSVLLLEARRTSPRTMLMPHCFNWDLRSFLILRCLERYPDDIRVAWAAGRIYLTAGKFESAAQQFKRVLDSGIDVTAIGGETPDRLLNRYLMALTMLGREDEVEAYVTRLAGDRPRSADARFTWLDYLCQRGRFGEVRRLAAAAQRDFPQDGRFQALLKRAAWWGGDLAEYKRLLRVERGAAKTNADLYFADARLALIDGDFATANRLLQFPSAWALQDYAEAYGATRDPALLAPLLAAHERLKPVLSACGDDSSKRWQFEERIEEDARYVDALMRAYSLSGEYGKISALDASLPPADFYDFWDHWTVSRDTAWLLASIAGKGPLRLRRLNGLLHAGSWVRLVRSEQFAAALAAGGRDRETVMEWVRILARPELQLYDDVTNHSFAP